MRETNTDNRTAEELGSHMNETTTKAANPNRIEVFDFRRKWDLVRPHLHDRTVSDTLDRGMYEFLLTKSKESGERVFYAPFEAEGPWSNCKTWFEQAEYLAQTDIATGRFRWDYSPGDVISDQDKRRLDKLLKKHCPKPRTFRWYQCYGAGHWLAPWQKELGKRVFPDLEWKLLKGPHHSFAYGADSEGTIKVIFDILNFSRKTAMELIELATRTDDICSCCMDKLLHSREAVPAIQAPEPPFALTE